MHARRHTSPARALIRRPAPAGVLGLAAAVVLLVLPAGLGGTPIAASPSVAPRTAPPFPTPIRHVVVVMLENQEAGDVLANGSYERSLAGTYAYASEFYAAMHFSLPNYLAATSGRTTNLLSPFHQTSVGSLALSIGRTWKEYEESMPYPCDLSPNTTAATLGGYDPYHNPFSLYEPFVNHSSICAAHMVNFTQLAADLGATTFPNYAFVVPNTTNDGHNSGLAGAEAWLSSWVPTIQKAPFYKTTALFVTYDEGTSNLGANGTVGGGRVYVALVSPYARMGFSSFTNYTTYSLLTTTEWLLGLGSTKTNDNWTTYPPMRDLFSFPYAVTGTVVDRNGTPVVAVAVSDHLGHSSRTNASGGFRLLLTDGNYTLYVGGSSGYKGHLKVTVSGAPVSGLILKVT